MRGTADTGVVVATRLAALGKDCYDCYNPPPSMPLYEYQCTECETTLEAIQAFSAPPLADCPECGQSSLKKLLSAPAFQFKGSGWYVNDYARKDNGNGKKPDGDATNGKPATSEGSSGQGRKPSDSTSSKSETSSPATTP